VEVTPANQLERLFLLVVFISHPFHLPQLRPELALHGENIISWLSELGAGPLWFSFRSIASLVG